MNIVRNDKVILVKEMENLKLVGETFEIANIVDDSVVIRDAKSKIAICAVGIHELDKYFKKLEEAVEWTPWTRLVLGADDVVAFYRVKGRKVQVKLADGTHSEANCNKCDEFNLYFGIQLAYERCLIKVYKKIEKEYEVALKNVRANISEAHHRAKMMINNTYKETVTEDKA